MDLASQSDMTPTQSFPSDNAAHFPAQSQYSFPTATGTFAVEQDMDMTESYPDHPTPSLSARIDSASSAAPAPNGTLPHDAGSINPGLSQTARGQHASPTSDRHRSSDDIQDPSLIGGDSKRKRSKVSRACDQCRKKKIRCDAETESGVLKTCSNCVKANQTCEYSRIPQKRGPSKGYIKELSERVQQVEGQLALQNASGYRSSLDGSSIGMYADPSFSPDEDTSRRHSSFSNQRNPFADFTRDRMPSVGGGWNTSSPHISRDRDRASIAIPPDQSLPTSSHTLVKPFWSDWSEQPPRKKRKMSNDNLQPLQLAEATLAKYYREIHPNLPILPKANIALEILREADPVYQHAFITSLKTMPSGETSGEIIQTVCDPTLQTTFKSRDDFEAFILAHANGDQEAVMDADKLVLFWICLIQAIKKEADMERLIRGKFSKSQALRFAIQLGSDHIKIYISTAADQNYGKHWDRAWHCLTILARLHALSMAHPDPVPEYHFANLAEPEEVLPAVTAYLAEASSFLDQAFALAAEVNANPTARRVITDNTRMTAYLRKTAKLLNLDPTNPVVREIDAFLRLLTARVVSSNVIADIVSPTINLAGILASKPVDSTGANAYGPLSIHTFTIVTYTLLELRQADLGTSDEGLRVWDALKDITHALEQIKERAGLEGWKEGEQHKITRVHWAEVLLNIIKGQVTESELEGVVDAPAGATTEDKAVFNFGALLNNGYLFNMLQYVKFGMQLAQI